MINNTNEKICYCFYKNYYYNSSTMSTYNNDVSYSKCKVTRERSTVRRQTPKCHVNFHRKALSVTSDVITLPMVIQTEINME